MFWIHYYNIQLALFQPLNAIYRAVPSSYDIAFLGKAILPALCIPDNGFCEPVQSAIIRQPINTLTNLIFIIAGILIAYIAFFDWFTNKNQRDKNLMRSHWIYPAIYGTTIILVGFGSIITHSTMNFFGQSLDNLGMYFIAIFIALYNYARMNYFSTKKFLLLYSAITVLCFVTAAFSPHLRRPLFIAMLVAILSSDILVRLITHPQASRKYFLASIFSLAIGCSAWILDIQNISFDPISLIQLHSIWHIGMGSAIFFLYLYYRSETVPHSSTTQTISKEEYAC